MEKIIREAGVDSENVEMHVWDGKKWRNLTNRRMQKIREWEDHMTTIHKSNQREKNKLKGVKEINEGDTYSFVTGKSVEKFVGQEQD